MTQFAQEFTLKVKEVKQKMLSGLDYSHAKIELQPYIDKANNIGAGVAKKYGKKYNKISFIGLMR